MRRAPEGDWSHYRGPDENVYGLKIRRADPMAPASSAKEVLFRGMAWLAMRTHLVEAHARFYRHSAALTQTANEPAFPGARRPREPARQPSC